MYVQVMKLWPPEHAANREAALTEWTDEGLAYYEAHKTDDPPAELTPGLHWKVIEPERICAAGIMLPILQMAPP